MQAQRRLPEEGAPLPQLPPSSWSSQRLQSWACALRALTPEIISRSHYICLEAAFHASTLGQYAAEQRKMCLSERTLLATALLQCLLSSFRGWRNFVFWIWSLIPIINTLRLQHFQGFFRGAFIQQYSDQDGKVYCLRESTIPIAVSN